MPHDAMFHKLGRLENADVYLEKFSRTLICLEGEAAARLARDCDKKVSVSDGVREFLDRGRLPGATLPGACRPHSQLKPGIELTLITTDRCNFACTYCFAHELYPGTQILDAETLIHHVRHFLNLCQTRISSLILFGGEPLLAFAEIHKAWPSICRLLRAHQGDMPSLAIVTNGSLITPEVARFLADNEFFATVSLDGPPKVHNACRPLRNGKESYERVVRGIEQLVAAKVFCTIEATYTKQHLEMGTDVLDVVDHALELGAQEIHVMPAFPEQASGIPAHENAHVAELFKAAAARAARRNLANGTVELAYASRLCYAFAHDNRRRYLCTAGIDKFTIMANGDITPCYLVCDADNVMDSCGPAGKVCAPPRRFAELARPYRELTRDCFAGCAECWASDWCFACYGPGVSRTGRLEAPGGLECGIYQAMIEATLLECARFLGTRQARLTG